MKGCDLSKGVMLGFYFIVSSPPPTYNAHVSILTFFNFDSLGTFFSSLFSSHLVYAYPLAFHCLYGNSCLYPINSYCILYLIVSLFMMVFLFLLLLPLSSFILIPLHHP